MKILLTGSMGQLAEEIPKAAKGHEVVAPEEKDLDITDFDKVKKAVAAIRPDVIINCAAYNDVDGAETEWRQAFLANGIGVRNLAVAGADSVIVHFSSDYVFDGTASKPYTIADGPNPINMYGRSKLLGEELLKSHAARYFLIRTSRVFGKGKHSFPKKVLEWASKGNELKVVDDQVSSPTYTVDLAEAVMALIETGNYGLYHITNSGRCSRFEWASFMLEKTGWKGTLTRASSGEFKTAARRPAFSALDDFPLERILGYSLPEWQDATERFIKGL